MAFGVGVKTDQDNYHDSPAMCEGTGLRESHHPNKPGVSVVRPWDKRLHATQFEYPHEVREMIGTNPDMKDELDELVESEVMRALACATWRLLDEIIQSEQPKATAIVMAYSAGLKVPMCDSQEAVLSSLRTLGMKRTRQWLHGQRKRVLALLTA